MKSAKLQLNNLEFNAYGLIGDTSVADELVAILENDFEIEKNGNQDFFYNKYENLTIDDARNLKKMHESRPVSAKGKKIFIVITDSINAEAQNALLKLLEEPASYAHFFIIIPQMNLLLPTVRSRLHFINTDKIVTKNADSNDLSEVVKKFLDAGKVKRLEIVKKVAEEISKDKKTKQYAIDFVNEIQRQIRSDAQNLSKSALALEVTQLTLKYLNDRAPSVKMLLEYVALNV
jgi:DNA polymerase-3 subunit delta'